MARKPDVLDHTVLGVLADGPLHGYELRKRLTAILGTFRALSFGSLYPCLHRLSEKGWVEPIDVISRREVASVASKRSRVVYALTPEGKEAFGAWVQSAGPDSWEDEAFVARMAFFSHTGAQVRLRILEGRRARLEERLQALEESISRASERVDVYAERLQQHSLESAEREVSWLEELIDVERGAREVRKSTRKARKVSPSAATARKNQRSSSS